MSGTCPPTGVASWQHQWRTGLVGYGWPMPANPPEQEGAPEMTTELLAAKYARVFAIVDLDGDGRAGLTDILALGARILTTFEANAALGSGKTYLDGLRGLWNVLVSNVNPDVLGRITLEQFQQAAEASWVKSAGGYDQSFGPLVDATLEIWDADRNGVIDLAEFTKLQQAVGTPPDQIQAAFQALDQDGDGALPCDQMRAIAQEFFTAQEQGAPGNQVFGQL
jgi:EF-hand domain pair